MELLEGLIKLKKMCDSHNSCLDCPIKSRYRSSCYFESTIPEHWGLEELKEYVKNIEFYQANVNWSNVAADTLIIVWDYDEELKRQRHFAKYENGKVYAWAGGRTSHTVSAPWDVIEWKHAELAEV